MAISKARNSSLAPISTSDELRLGRPVGHIFDSAICSGRLWGNLKLHKFRKSDSDVKLKMLADKRHQAEKKTSRATVRPEHYDD